MWRRRLLPVGLAYLATAVLLGLAADRLSGLLGLPGWMDEAVLGGLALLFLPTLWLAWTAGGPESGRAPRAAAPRTAAATIAVLPFANLSQQPEDEVFADGIVEDLITGLALSSTLRVISRTSTFAYKDQSVDLREVAADLGCDYVLAGSVRRLGDRLRVSVQLVDGGTGSHVWTDKYDRPVSDLFGLQDELMCRIVAALGDAVVDAQLDRLRRNPSSVSAWEEAMRALFAQERPSLESAQAGLAHARKAVRLDPDFAVGHAYLSSTLTLVAQFTGGEGAAPMFREAEAAIDRALDLAPNNPKVLASAAAVLGLLGRPDEAIRHGLRSRQLNPHDSNVVGALGNAHYFAGRYAEACAFYEEEARMSPRSLFVISRCIFHGLARMSLGEIDRAEAVLMRGLGQDPGYETAWMGLVLARVLRGDPAGAAEAVRGLRVANPQAKLDRWTRVIASNVRHPAVGQLVEGFRQAWAAA